MTWKGSENRGDTAPASGLWSVGKEATPTREALGAKEPGVPVLPLKHGGEGRRMPEGTVVMTVSPRRLSRRTWWGGMGMDDFAEPSED